MLHNSSHPPLHLHPNTHPHTSWRGATPTALISPPRPNLRPAQVSKSSAEGGRCGAGSEAYHLYIM